MDLYSIRPINHKDDMNPYIETDYVTEQFVVGQPVPYRIQKMFDNQALILMSMEEFICKKCNFRTVKKKVFEKGFNYKFLALYRKTYCDICEKSF